MNGRALDVGIIEVLRGPTYVEVVRRPFCYFVLRVADPASALALDGITASESPLETPMIAHVVQILAAGVGR